VGSGLGNTGSGTYSCAPGGVYARASHLCSFVFGGDSGGVSECTDSSGDGTFTVRCEGGARFYTANGTDVGVQLCAGGGAWASLSDSNAKMKITGGDPRRILAKVASMPVTEGEDKAAPDHR
jgi:hypothetical protein